MGSKSVKTFNSGQTDLRYILSLLPSLLLFPFPLPSISPYLPLFRKFHIKVKTKSDMPSKKFCLFIKKPNLNEQGYTQS